MGEAAKTNRGLLALLIQALILIVLIALSAYFWKQCTIYGFNSKLLSALLVCIVLAS